MENTILTEAAQVSNEAFNKTSEQGLSDDARNIALAMSLASRDETIRNTPEMQQLMGLIEKTAEAPKPKATQTPTFEGEPKNAPKPANTDNTEADGGAKSIFFASKQEAPIESKYDLNSIEGIKSFFSDNYGTDSIQAAAAKVVEAKKAQDQLEALAKQQEEVQNFLVGLPDELYDAMEAHYHGQDYKKVLARANSKVDFTKPFESNNEVEVVNHYFPGDFSAEDFTDKASNEVLQKAIGIAKKSFERDSQAAIQEKQALLASMEVKNEAVKRSIDASIQQLKKTFPEISENAIKNIQKSMVTGDYKSIFFNQDGTFTSDAAKSIALAMYGDQEIRKTASGKARQEANKIVEEVVTRGSDKPKDTARNSATNANPQNNDFMKFIGSYLPSNNTYSAKS